MFTYFKAPIKNTSPYKDISLSDVYKAIRGDYYKAKTEYLRSITDPTIYKKEKSRILDYVTFAGTFNRRIDAGLKELSGLMCLDFDHIQNLEFLKRNLIKDPILELHMVFVSPAGDGLKVIITNPHNSGDYKADYSKIDQYIWTRYAQQIDKTNEVSRACFMCHDPNVWVSKDVLLQKMIKENPDVGTMVKRLDLIKIKD